jgi:prolyl 4-hydroxylase
MNMTLKVLSCAPRAFEIPNFLSQVEVHHIVELASGIKLSLSSTGDIGSDPEERSSHEDTRRTRTSYNSWVPREKSPIVDAIYRRAADLMRIDERLLRSRTKEESKDVEGYTNPLCEQLQLVHYDKTQEYTAHHDFGFARIDDPYQGARFGTLLLYLNSDVVGGETSFPRWVNAETFDELKIKPEAGKAVLFYSQLPDGNMDDFSQHAAKPVIRGEKWVSAWYNNVANIRLGHAFHCLHSFISFPFLVCFTRFDMLP